MDNIADLLGKIEVLPASPALLPKITHVLANIDDSNVDEMVDIIAFDAALTAKLLQIANSPYFGCATPVTNVGEAVSQVGYDTVFLLASAISGEGCLRPPPGTGLDSVLMWKHSVTAAFGAQHIAQAAGRDANLIFTAGLLHDLGKVVFAGAYRTNYTQIFDPSRREGMSLVDWERVHYGCDHAQLGAALLNLWKLPAPLVAGVRYHHQFQAAGENVPIAACVFLGDVLSHSLELTVFALDPANPDIPPALQLLNITATDMRKQWERIHQNWEFVQKLCELRK